MQKPASLDRVFLVPALVVTLLITIVAAIPQCREQIRDRFLADSRQVLAKVEGDLTGQGDWVSVVKVKTKTDLLLEVYSLNPEKNATSLRARLILPGRKDGYFQLGGQPTNLALVDLNNDGILEIAVPTFDDNLIPRLHVYRYDPAAQVFQLTGPDFIPLDPIGPSNQ